MLNIYNQKSLSAKISNKFSKMISNTMTEKLNMYNDKFKIITDFLLSIMPKKVMKVIELRKSLNKLEKINKSVDELMSLNIPYGENINKYNQLSKFIVKANSIHSELSNFDK